MSARRWKSSWRPLKHRLCAGVAAASYLTAAFGLPVTPLPDKDRSRPFPCQNHVCGCHSAAECWQHCCCFSHQERLAWAHTHEVEAPTSAEPVTAQGWRTPRGHDQAENGGQPGTTCARCLSEQTKTADLVPAECGSDSESVPTYGNRPPSTGKRSGSLLLNVAAMQCHGMSTVWISVGAVLRPPPALTWSPYLAAGDWLSHPDLAARTLCQGPLDPPPRLSHA
jgi:hypothetical protein